MSIFIYGNVPSKKNSKNIRKNTKTGKFFITSSDLTKQYEKSKAIQYQARAAQFHKESQGKELPLHIEFRFVREQENRFDFNNLSQIVLDLMVKYKWISDDNYKIVVPHFNPVVSVDEKNAGVEITIL